MPISWMGLTGEIVTYSLRSATVRRSKARTENPRQPHHPPGEANQISVGPGFESLKAYRPWR